MNAADLQNPAVRLPIVRLARNATVAGTLALLMLCILWETTLAPIRPGSWLWIKALPLLLPLRGLIAGRRYTYQWMCMFVLLWFTEGVMRAWGDRGTSQWLAGLEVFLSLLIFTATVVYARFTRHAPPP